MLTLLGFAVLATEASGVSAADWVSVIEGVTSQFSVSTIVAVIASVVAAGIGFVFLWWGVRLAFGSIMGAVKNGTLSINSKRRRRR